jgi:hypothetical protein
MWIADLNVAVTAAFLMLLTPVSTRADELKIVAVKAYAFLEHADKLSDDLVGSQTLVNAPRGGLVGGDTATAILLDFTFEGEKDASPKNATATVDLTQTGVGGRRIATHKVFDDFSFGDDGIEHKAIFLEGATCLPLAISVRAGKTTKSVRIDFRCDVAPKQG